VQPEEEKITGLAICRYDIADLIGNKTGSELTVGYARVSIHDRKDDIFSSSL
jgi:predicted site-specific integrase-resolvase